METRAFRMKLRPGCADAYRHRHDAIWPELVALLRESGVQEYHIFLDEESNALFAFQRLAANRPPAADLTQHPVMRRWWDHMADLMEVNPDNSPVVVPCPELFRLAPDHD